MRHILPVFLLLAIGIIIYSNSLGNDFIWDDEIFVTDNVAVRDFRYVPTYFTSPRPSGIGGDNYRPLVPLSYAFDFSFWGLNPMGYHLTNTALHIINAVLLFFIVCRFAKDRFIAFMTSVLFLTHPIQTESVTWIAGRSSVLFLFFFLISFLFYLRYRSENQGIFYVISLLVFMCALLSKEMAASLPFILVLYDWCYGVKEDRIRVIRYIPFFAVLLSYIALRYAVTGKFEQCGYLTGSFYTTALTMVRGVAHYIRLLIYPVGLCADYLSFTVSTTITEPAVIISSGAIILALWLGVRLMRRVRHISFGIFWFFITLLPVLNIIPIRTFIAERFLYLPSIGFVLAISVVFRYLCIRLRNRGLAQQAVSLCMISLIVVYSALTMARNRTWSDEIVFNKDIIARYPDNERAHFNLARPYITRERNFDKAYKEIAQTLALAPHLWKARRMLSSYYFWKGRFDDAARELEYVIKLKPRLGYAYNSLAYVYAVQGRYDLVDAQYRKMFTLNDSVFYRRLCTAEHYVLAGEIEKALSAYSYIAAGQLDPTYDASYASLYLLMGALHCEMGNSDGAYRMWRQAEMSSDRHTVLGEISRYLTGGITLEELLSEAEFWQPRYRVMVFYYVAVKRQTERDREGAQTYFRRCIDEPIGTVEFYKTRAVQRLRTLPIPLL